MCVCVLFGCVVMVFICNVVFMFMVCVSVCLTVCLSNVFVVVVVCVFVCSSVFQVCMMIIYSTNLLWIKRRQSLHDSHFQHNRTEITAHLTRIEAKKHALLSFSAQILTFSSPSASNVHPHRISITHVMKCSCFQGVRHPHCQSPKVRSCRKKKRAANTMHRNTWDTAMSARGKCPKSESKLLLLSRPQEHPMSCKHSSTRVAERKSMSGAKSRYEAQLFGCKQQAAARAFPCGSSQRKRVT